MRISDWSSDVCSSDLERSHLEFHGQNSGELCHGEGLEAPERRRDRGFGVIPATKRRRESMDIRGPGRFLNQPGTNGWSGWGRNPRRFGSAIKRWHGVWELQTTGAGSEGTRVGKEGVRKGRIRG